MKRIVVIGFYGHGNSGDEAIAHVIAGVFSDCALTFATLAGHAEIEKLPTAYWYHERHRLVSMLDVQALDGADLVIRGGGGLDVGFGLSLIAQAEARGIPCVSIGCSISGALPKTCVSAWSSFRFRAVRDEYSRAALGLHGLDSVLSSDLAMILPIGSTAPLVRTTPYVTVTVRDVLPQDRQVHINKVRAAIERIGQEHVVLLPLCAGDAVISRLLAEAYGCPLVVTDVPEAHKAIIHRARAAITFGRFHPIVYAHATGVPCFAVPYGGPPHGGFVGSEAKIKNFVSSLGPGVVVGASHEAHADLPAPPIDAHRRHQRYAHAAHERVREILQA